MYYTELYKRNIHFTRRYIEKQMMEGEEGILKYIFCGKELLYFF